MSVSTQKSFLLSQVLELLVRMLRGRISAAQDALPLLQSWLSHASASSSNSVSGSDSAFSSDEIGIDAASIAEVATRRKDVGSYQNVGQAMFILQL